MGSVPLYFGNSGISLPSVCSFFRITLSARYFFKNFLIPKNAPSESNAKNAIAAMTIAVMTDFERWCSVCAANGVGRGITGVLVGAFVVQIGERSGGILPKVGMSVVVTVVGTTNSLECVVDIVDVTVFVSVDVIVFVSVVRMVVERKTVCSIVKVVLNSRVLVIVSVTKIVCGPFFRRASMPKSAALSDWPENDRRKSMPGKCMFAKLANYVQQIWKKMLCAELLSLLVSRTAVEVEKYSCGVSINKHGKWWVIWAV